MTALWVVFWRGPLVCCWLAGVFLLAAVAGAWQDGREASGPRAGPVLIDPGHGGIDGGANRAGVLEKEITLAVGQRLKQHLLARGVPVAMSRVADVDLGGDPNQRGRHRRDLEARARTAERSGAAALVSLHVNSAGDTSQRGPLIFFRRHSPSSRLLAELIHAQLAEITPLSEVRPLPADFFVLREAPCPAVLVEMGYMTNAAEREALGTESYREALAEGLAEAIAVFYTRWLHVPPIHVPQDSPGPG